MAWYELVALVFFLGAFLFVFVYALLLDIRLNKERIVSLRKAQHFYEVASEWFYHQNNNR